MPNSRPAFLLSVCVVLLVSSIGCGQVCDLDRRVGGLVVDVPWLTDDAFAVSVSTPDRTVSWSCGPLVDGARATTDDDTESDTDLLPRCAPQGFGLSTTAVPSSATFSLVQSSERHTLTLDDIETVDDDDDDCHEPVAMARVTWSVP